MRKTPPPPPTPGRFEIEIKKDNLKELPVKVVSNHTQDILTSLGGADSAGAAPEEQRDKVMKVLDMLEGQEEGPRILTSYDKHILTTDYLAQESVISGVTGNTVRKASTSRDKFKYIQEDKVTGDTSIDTIYKPGCRKTITAKESPGKIKINNHTNNILAGEQASEVQEQGDVQGGHAGGQDHHHQGVPEELWLVEGEGAAQNDLEGQGGRGEQAEGSQATHTDLEQDLL
jgi:hypothetical protein